MATERIEIVVTSSGTRRVARDINDIGTAGGGAARGVGLLKSALATLGVGVAASQLVSLADGYTNLLNRLRLVTTSTANLAAVNDRLYASANRTRSSYEATAELYGSLARSAQGLGLSQQQLLGITETVNQAMRVSGADGATAAASLRQLGQALGSGTLRGDELNSVLENTPRLAQAIAAGMGVTVGQLRQLGAQGKLTSQQIVQAIQSQAPQIASEFGRMAPTIGEALTVLQNGLMRFVGGLDQATGTSAALAGGLIFLSGHLGTVAALAAAAGAAFLWQRAAAGVQAVTAAMRALNLAMLANPITLIIAAVGLAVAAFVEFGDQVKVTSDGAVSLKDAFFGALSLISDAARTVAAFFMEAWRAASSFVGGVLARFGTTAGNVMTSILGVVKAVVNGYIGSWVAAFEVVKAAWNNFPGAMNVIFTAVINLAASAAEATLNAWQAPLRGIIAGIGYINGEAGAKLNGLMDNLNIRVPRAKLSAAGRAAGADILSGVTGAFQRDYLGQAWGAVVDRARSMKGAGGAGALGAGGAPRLGGGAAALKGHASAARDAAKADGDLADAMRRRDALLDELGGAQRVYDKAVANADDLLKRHLITQQQHDQALALASKELREADPLWRQVQSLISESITPTERLAEKQNLLNDAWRRGAISAADYLKVQRELDADKARLAEQLYPTDQMDGLQRRGGSTQDILAGAVGDGPGGKAIQGLGEAASNRSALSSAHTAASDNLKQQQAQGLIDHKTYTDRLAELDRQYSQQRMANTASMFGALASLSESGNKKLAAIGKAAAIAQATIDGYLAIQKALSAFPPPFNFVAAAAVGVATAANIASIAGIGFRDGGYTGSMGVGEVAGVVHGQEFVVNAEATRRWMPWLEAINAGSLPGYASGGYVSKRGAASPSMALGGGGSVSPGAGGAGGITIEKGAFQIDARGAEHGVEEKIDERLSEVVPIILAKASRQEDAKRARASGRQRIGSSR